MTYCPLIFFNVKLVKELAAVKNAGQNELSPTFSWVIENNEEL